MVDARDFLADQDQDRLQVFNREGQLPTYIGDTHANAPGQFKALVGVAIDKQNRVFTTEQYPGRMQMFRYITDDEAAAEKKKREDEAKQKADARRAAATAAPAAAPATTAPAEAPAQKPDTTAPKDMAPVKAPSSEKP